jgi:hypothetical protein
MIFRLPTPEEPLDQGDVIDGCPVTVVAGLQVDRIETAQVELDLHRVIVLTQTCDLANDKANAVLVASVFDAKYLVDNGVVKATDLKGPIRAGRVYGLYFLPGDASLGVDEMVIDLRRVHTVRPAILSELCRAGKRRARLLTPYREHLAKHFADTYCRIGLPDPYETR